MIACARSKIGFDKENELSCDNYKCFKLLLSLDDNDENDAKLVINRRYGRNDQRSVMMSCILFKKIECVKLLIDHCRKYNINFKNDYSRQGLNGLMLAMSKNEKITQLLMKNIDLFDVNRGNYIGGIFTYPIGRAQGWYDRDFIMECDYKKCLDVAFDEMSRNGGKSFDPTVLDMCGQGIFHTILEKGCRIPFFDYFIQQGRDKCGWNINELIKNYRSRENDTLFHVAVQQGSLQHLKYLLKLNVLDDINIIGGKNDDTLLNTCIQSRSHYDEVTYKSGVNYQIFELLLSQPGINPNISNKFGYNAFDLCRRSQK